MEEHKEYFQCSHCGAKLNFKKESEEHEANAPSETNDRRPQTFLAQRRVLAKIP